MKRILLYITVLVSFLYSEAQDIRLITDLTNEYPSGHFVAFNNKVYFNANGISNPTGKIYSIDDNDNVQLELELNSPIYDLTPHDGFLYFTSSTGTDNVSRINRIDASGNFNVVSGSFGAYDLISYNGELYFSGEANKVEDGRVIRGDLWAYNASIGSFRLIDTNYDYGMSIESKFIYNGELYFTGEIAELTFDNALYKTDGISITQALDYSAAILGTNRPRNFTAYNGKIYFDGIVDIANFDYRLFEFDPITNTFTNVPNYFGEKPHVFNGALYYSGRSDSQAGTTYGLIRFDGSSSTSIPISTANGTIINPKATPFFSSSTNLYAAIRTDEVGVEAFVLRNNEFSLVRDVNPGLNFFLDINTLGVIEVQGFNDRVYVAGEETDTGSQFFTNVYTIEDNACIETINIPDAIFEAYLENVLNVGDGILGNGLVCKEQIELITALDISNQGINDLSGLEAFSALETLNVSDNDLNSLVLQNTNLVEIRANNCNLGGKQIRFQNAPPNGQFLTNVTRLELQNNGIGSPGSTISFGGVPNVTYLDISDNNFGTIQLNESTSIETLLANNCPNLTTLANLGSLGNLESLGASFSSLSELDVSQNGQLSFLNISGNTLTSLDLSNNNVIGSVYAGDNDLATISLPTTTTLSELYVENNALTALNVSTADQNLFDLDATGNPNLPCIQLSNLDFAQRAWSIDTGTSYSTNCSPQPFTVTASIPGTTGNPPAIIITEGNSFTLNFESGPTSPNGTQYTPSVVFTSNNNNNPTDDFTYNGNNSLPTAPFIVSSANPDGGITILPIDDGVTEGDETYTITISSPDPSLFTIEGPTSFEVMVRDNVSTPYIINVTLDNVQIENGSFFIPEVRSFFEIQIDVPNAPDGLEFSSSIDFSRSMFIEEDLSFYETDFTATTSSSNTDYQNQISFFLDDSVSELDDKIVLVLGKPDNENFVWSNANANGEAIFEIAVLDDLEFSTTPVDVVLNSTNLTLLPADIGFQPYLDNFSFPENSTENITISFATENLNNNPISEYELRIQTSSSSAEEGNDFVTIDEIRTFSVNDNNEHVIEIEILDDDLLETDVFGNSETFLVNISSITPGVRIKSFNGVLLEEDVDYSLNIEIIDDDNISEPFEVDVQLNGNFSNENGNLSIVEGENFEITFNSESPAAENYIYTIQYDTQGSNSFDETNYTLPNSPMDIRVLNTSFSEPQSNPIDAQINFEVLNDLEEDAEELLVINFRPDIENIYTWKGADENGVLTFTINVLENRESNNQIIAKFSSTGGIEGGTDTYTIALTDQQGNPFTNDTGGNIEFQLNFTNERDANLSLEIAQGDVGVPADEGSYIAEIGDSLDDAKIIIEPDQSSGTYIVNYPSDNDTDREFYTVEIELLVNQEAFDLQPSKIQSIILDGQGDYYAAIFPKPDGDLKLLPNVGEFNQSCCAGFSVEENSIIEFYVDVEKGVPATENVNNPSFEIGFTFGGDSEISTSTERKDFSKRDDNDALEIIVNPSEPLFDNRLLLDIWDDDIPNERVKLDEDGNPETTSIGEKLLVNFTSQSDNLILKSPIFGDVYTFESFGALPATSFDIRIIDVLSVASFESVEGKSVALEEGETTAEFEIVLSEKNVSGNDIVINYEILQNQSNSANPLNDFLVLDADLNLNTLRGQTVVLPGDDTAKIILKAEDDARFEFDEFVTIRLLPGNGYSIGEGFTSQITIISEDEAEYTATIIQGADNASRESQTDDFAEVILELKESPVDDTIEVFFKISDKTDQTEVVEGEGQDYLIYQADKETVIPPNNRKVVFEANGENRKSIFVKALLDDLEEDNESLFLALDDGVNYRAGIPNEAQVILQSATTDLTSFKPASISVVSKKPRCPGDNQEGFIEISNASGFEFDIVIYNDTENEVDRFLLGTNSSDDRLKNSKPLTIGRYEVILEFKGEKPENAIAPRYVVQIEKLEDMSVEEQGVDLKSKTGSFLVSGSQSYTLSTEIGVYNFDFEDTGEHLITLPLEPGLNSIEIKGDAVCLGTIKKEILLENIFIFPNPSYEIVSLMGESLKEFKGLVLFDMQGKLVFEKTTSDTGINKMEINISSLQRGMYLGKIRTGNNQTVEFKLIKR